jgi:hypothetical protein
MGQCLLKDWESILLCASVSLAFLISPSLLITFFSLSCGSELMYYDFLKEITSNVFFSSCKQLFGLSPAESQQGFF